MSDKERYIQILPHGRQIKAQKGSSLLEALMQKSIFLRSDCGGKGRCGKCMVHKINENGSSEVLEACMLEITEDICVEIPESSVQSSHIMTKADVSLPVSFKKRFSDNDTSASYGFAVDLGTTTIAVYLCNTATGTVVSSCAVKNPQAIYGDDVMSRIGIIGQEPDHLEKLQMLVVKSIEWGIENLLSSSHIKDTAIPSVTVVGNPTMIHILAGIDPAPIGVFPYQPSFYDAKQFKSDQLGFGRACFTISTLPQISGFIGGDILAAALAVEFEKQPDGTLLIDLGTNGELLLKHKNNMYAASCATGPAFEGASLSCGIQAIPGAINAVEIDHDKKIIGYSTITGEKSSAAIVSGICGAGVINCIAQFRNKNIIRPGGAFESGEKEYILVPENSNEHQAPIYISQKDIRSVQLGKSALITGIEFLLKKAGIHTPEKILIAGAFGSHLNKVDLITLGMIPAVDPEKIEISGNSAGAGAIMTLCDSRFHKMARQMTDTIETVELAGNVDFQQVFIKNLNFPG